MSAVIASLAKAIGQLSDRAIWRVVLKSVIITLIAFVLFGAALWWGVDHVLDARLAAFLPDGARGAAAGVLAVALWLLSFWLLFRLVALAVLQFFADEIVAAIEARHYPDAAARARPLPLRRDITNSLRSIGRAVAVNALALPFAAVLLFTAIGPALVFLAANAWLLGRELTDMAWLRHCGESERANPVPPGQRALLGGAIAAAMLVPFANLVAPIIGAAAGTHLTQRAMLNRSKRPAKDVSHA